MNSGRYAQPSDFGRFEKVLCSERIRRREEKGDDTGKYKKAWY
jgi:hypothetical protein